MSRNIEEMLENKTIIMNLNGNALIKYEKYPKLGINRFYYMD